MFQVSLIKCSIFFSHENKQKKNGAAIELDLPFSRYVNAHRAFFPLRFKLYKKKYIISF